MKFTKYNSDNILVDFYTGLPVEDSSVDIDASGKIISSVSMMDAKLKLPTARQAYIDSLSRTPKTYSVLLQEYRERNIRATSGGFRPYSTPENGGVES